MKKIIIILILLTVILIFLIVKKPKMDQKQKNVNAFLKVIQFAEGTAKQPDPYRVVFGFGHTIKNMNDHPAIIGEWTGQKLPDNLCIKAGQSVGCKSTGAGAYQFISPTWKNIKKAIPGIKFDKAGQDQGAIYLIKKYKALADLESGNIYEAINKLNKVWASLPGAPYGQPTKKMNDIINFFKTSGGQLV